MSPRVVRKTEQETLADALPKSSKLTANGQILMRPTKFYDYVASKIGIQEEPIYLFFFYDKVHIINTQINFQPVAIVYKKDDRLQILDVNEIRKDLGDDFGVRFTRTKFRNLNPEKLVNLLVINGYVKTFVNEKDEEIRYHDCSIRSFKELEDFEEKVKTMYYSDAEKFEVKPFEVKPIGSADEWANLDV